MVNPKNVLLLVLGVGCIAAGGLAWQQRLELTRLRAGAEHGGGQADRDATIVDLQRRNRDLMTALAAVRAEEKIALASGSETPRAVSGALAGASALPTVVNGKPTDGAPGGKRDEDLELLSALADTPEFQKLLAVQQRGKMEEKYSGLFKRLQLAPDDLARVQRLLTDRESAFGDALLAARAQGLDGKQARQVASDVARASQKEITASLRTALGLEGFNQLQNFERTAPQRETVGQLAQRLSYTTAPLSEQQQNQLVRVLASGEPKTDANGAVVLNKNGTAKTQPAASVGSLPGTVSGFGLGASTGTTLISNNVVTSAQSFLSPAQVSALQRLQQEQQAQQSIGNLLRTGTVNRPVKTKPAKPGG